MGAVPEALEAIDAAFLAEHTGWHVESVEIESIGAGVGFIGQLARLWLTGEGTPPSVIAKLPTADPGGRMLGQMMRLWEREHHFYAHVAHQLHLRTPLAHVNLFEPDGPASVLILEDLAPLRPGDQVAGVGPDEAALVIDHLAAFHAQWWEHPSLDTFEWMPSIDDPMVEMVGPMFHAGWSGFCDRYAGTLPDRTLRWAERFVSLVPNWLATYREAPRTILHGDARLDNMFFGDVAAGESPFAVVDWQMAMRAPGGGDLAYFVLTNLDSATRRAHERDLVARYGEVLLSLGVPADQVDLTALWQGYLEGVLFYCVSFSSSLLSLDPANERGLALIDALVDRVFTAADDLEVGDLVIQQYQ
jgi:aminoglycoside/choline kinase family phosphotransferase